MGMVDYNTEDLLPAVVKSLNDKGVDYDSFFSGAYRDIHPLWPLSMLNNISFCQVAIDLGIKGENATFAPHSDSALQSIIEAYNTVLEGRAKVVLAGGVSEKVSPFSMARASLFGILNINNDLCSPFGSDRQGTFLGEGSGVVTVELRSAAEERQVDYVAEISGYGSSFESEESSNCATSKAVSQSMEQALAKAKLNPSDIDLIIAHGDGTPGGDKNELEAIHHTFAGCVSDLPVFSSKASLGHMLSGASSADVILGTQMLNHGIIPPVPGSMPVDESVKFNLVTELNREIKPTRILINAQSYEGQSSSLIINRLDRETK